MADSPKSDTNGPVKLTIEMDGKAMDETYQLISVRIEKSVNKIPWVQIEMADGDMPKTDFPISNTDDFKPGASITIKAGYGQQEDSIFEGLVIGHGIRISRGNQARLMIECRDAAVKMTVGRKNANYVDMKDSDILSTIIGGHAGLSSDVTATQVQYDELVQFYCTDWDFMLSRAEVNGLLVIVNDGKVTVAPPGIDAEAKLTVAYGSSLIELEAGMDARSQFASVKGAAWDLQTQKMVEKKSPATALNAQGNLSSSDLSGVIGLTDYCLQTTIPLDQDGLQAWADAQQLKSGLARIRGQMKFQGSAKVNPGDLVELTGAGDRFNGSVFAATVTHVIAEGDWTTTVGFGLAPDWFAEAKDIQAPAAAGLLPGVDGLQIGVVLQIHEDPAGQYKVKVKVPVLQAQTQGVWARLAGSYASTECGAFFFPEIGDEVVLGYFNNDPCHPVILGSLYSNKIKSPYTPADGNNLKALVTRGKLKVELDEEKKIITVVTPGGNQIVLSDDEKAICLTDQNANKVTLNPDGITLDSPKDIAIKATGKITLQATGEIDVTSDADVKVAGLNIENSANAGFTAKGNASAEVSASGQTTVKGAMVMIN
ncbi:MAG: type VI secretion system tip protein VgrG [Desulfatitalea sp.]|nr:type VI secretion system tip protein VgrG [Desulfatitalea sp.]NNK00616.1 type VI secretion system tip protein VgrG [Desulfatitalea sp.]